MSQSPTTPTAGEPTTAEKIRLLPWGVAANAGNMVFVQFTFFGSAFILFLNQLELNNSQIGFLLSLFPFFGLVALFIAPAVARFGYKRTFLLFYGLRKIVAGFLLLVPWVLNNFGSTATLIFIMGIVILFALFRATAETALYPWAQEYIPDSVRGKFAATNNIFSNITGVITAAAGGYIIGQSAGLDRFLILFAIGVIFGLLSVWFSSFKPGGAPIKGGAAATTSSRDLLEVLRDKNMLSYLAGFGLITLGTVPAVSFLPLFMQNIVGLSAGTVVWLQTGTLIGGLASTYFWGWAADRYGSKPIMLSGILLKILLPIGWLLIPQNSPLSLTAALAISLLQGISDIGWNIGAGRLLYVRVVPRARNASYMAVYYATIGIFGGLSQLAGGWILDASAGLTGEFLTWQLNPFLPLFALALTLPLFSLFMFRAVKGDSPVTVTDFAGKFIQGNPLMALTVLPRYYWAKDEEAAVSMTEQLGQTNSPLTVEELLDALADPRFNVRFEAIISIARMKSDPRLVQALSDLLHGTELSLTVMAAWALGRIGDEHALVSLREGLDSDYRSIRAHCARALGTLGDTEIAPLLLERLATEEDKGLQMAYASALGRLSIREAVPLLLETLATTANSGARMELALSLARITGDERGFIQLLRGARADLGTSFSQHLAALIRKISKNEIDEQLLAAPLRRCAEMFARQELDAGARDFGRILTLWPRPDDDPTASLILDAAAQQLQKQGSEREEYLLLALRTLEVNQKGD